MDGNTKIESIASAKKNHKCTWCDQEIKQGQPYNRWRSFYQGDASTTKMHLECRLAFGRWSRENGYFDEWHAGEFSRGCTCANGECTVENCPTDACINAIPDSEKGGS